MRQLRAGEEVAGVGILGHHPQRLTLTAAANQDRRMRSAQALGHIQRPPELVMLAGEWLFAASFAFHQGKADLERFPESPKPFAVRREWNAGPRALRSVPGAPVAAPAP